MAAGGKILVIDDTELIRMIYRDRLKAEGYEVDVAPDGIDGLKLAIEWQPSLILLDLVMPRQDGLQTLEQLKADPRTKAIPVVILSNRDDEEEIKTGLKLGAEDYLKKVGASPAEVTQKIQAILEQKGAPAVESGQPARPATPRIYIRDREGDADALAEIMGLPRRFWCPACEQELVLELVVEKETHGGHWFKAHLICPSCSKNY